MVGRKKPQMLVAKQFGLQRSGTNYLRYLLEKNYKVKILTNEGGWKHGYYQVPWTLGKESHLVICIKNPYSWLVSCFRYLQPKLNFNEFIEHTFIMPGEIFSGEGKYPYAIRAKNPIQYWNNMNWHWINIKFKEPKKRKYIFLYENLIENPESAINLKIGKLRNTLPFDDPENEMRRTWDKHETDEMLTEEKFTRRHYYNEKLYLNEYTEPMLKFVSKEVDQSLMEDLSYGIV